MFNKIMFVPLLMMATVFNANADGLDFKKKAYAAVHLAVGMKNCNMITASQKDCFNKHLLNQLVDYGTQNISLMECMEMCFHAFGEKCYSSVNNSEDELYDTCAKLVYSGYVDYEYNTKHPELAGALSNNNKQSENKSQQNNDVDALRAQRQQNHTAAASAGGTVKLNKTPDSQLTQDDKDRKEYLVRKAKDKKTEHKIRAGLKYRREMGYDASQKLYGVLIYNNQGDNRLYKICCQWAPNYTAHSCKVTMSDLQANESPDAALDRMAAESQCPKIY